MRAGVAGTLARGWYGGGPKWLRLVGGREGGPQVVREALHTPTTPMERVAEVVGLVRVTWWCTRANVLVRAPPRVVQSNFVTLSHVEFLATYSNP